MMAEAVSRSLTSDCTQFASLSLSLNSSSAQAVISNHDLLSEILSYVPVRPLICFQLVSKQWLSLITSTQFALLHYRRRRWTSPPSAIFLESEFLLSRGFETHMLFVHLNRDKIHKNPFRYSSFSHDSFDPKKVLIMQSCHGLLLCRAGIVVTQVLLHPCGLFHKIFYVYNPTTNQLATIDLNWSTRMTIHAAVLDFDPSKSPHYKVVFCVSTPRTRAHQRRFVIYHSETKTWKLSALHSFVPPIILSLSNFAYFKGSIYWIITLNANLVLSYNVDADTLATLPSPTQKGSTFGRRSLYFGESAGHLHIAEVFACAASSLDVYELNTDRSGWFIKFKVDLDQLSKDFPVMSDNRFTSVNEYAFSVLSLVRGREDFDEDSVLVLEVPGKVIVYNLVDQSWKEVYNFCPADKARDWPCGNFKAIDYNESLAPASW